MLDETHYKLDVFNEFLGQLEEFTRILQPFKDIFVNIAGKNKENLEYFSTFT